MTATEQQRTGQTGLPSISRTFATASSALNHSHLTVPAAVVDDVLKAIFASSDDVLLERIQALANSQPDLCAFILNSPLPPSASFPAALSAFAILWMFQQHHQPRVLPKIGVASIRCCVDSSVRSFLDFDNPHSTMAGRKQPHIHKFIADTIFDFDEDKQDGFDLFTLFLMLKTTVDVLHAATSNTAAADSEFVLSAAAR